MRCVTDANIWIDLDHGGLLGRVFNLDCDLSGGRDQAAQIVGLLRADALVNTHDASVDSSTL